MKNFDNSFLTENTTLLAGIDEAGRGPLAGPVVAACVVFNKEVVIEGVNDSKKLSEKKRNLLYDIIIEKALSYGIGIIENEEIDKINILQATLKAMKRASEKLSVTPDIILVDGNKSFYTKTPIQTVVKGDAKSFAIASASILAKVTRDRMMKEAAVEYPNYDWLNNKGYGTKKHIEAIKKYGPTSLHRMNFLGNVLGTKDKQLIINKFK